MNVNYIQSVIQVLAESSSFYFFLKIFVCRRNYTNINFYSLLSADTFKFFFSKNPKNFYLNILIYFPDFIKKNCASVGKFKSAFLQWSAPVKAPFSCPKSSLSKRVSLRAAQWTFIIVLSCRGDKA